MIYLDHNATTRPHPEVIKEMARATEIFGNPSSPHGAGRRARQVVEQARAQVAGLLGVASEEIVFCSGGTEGDQLAIVGGARAERQKSGRHGIVSSPLEHPAVKGSLELLEREGFAVRRVGVAGDGTIDPEELSRALDGSTALVTLAAANHELGNRYSIAEFAARAHAVGALFHSDLVQAAGKVPLDLSEVDLATLSAHKIYGPKGMGALFVRRGIEIAPLTPAGHQERGRRPGTENVMGIVGLGAACALLQREGPAWAKSISLLRDRLEQSILAISGARRFGGSDRVPGTCNVGFRGITGEVIMQNLDLSDVAVSTGAACTSGSLEPSPVIRALGFPREEAAEAVRFSLGWANTEAEIDVVVAALGEIVRRLRQLDLGKVRYQ